MVNRGDTGPSTRQLEAQKCGGSWKEGLEFPAISAKGEATGVLLYFIFVPSIRLPLPHLCGLRKQKLQTTKEIQIVML